MPKMTDLTGKAFGNLQIGARAGTGQRGEILYSVSCVCGCGQVSTLRAAVVKYKLEVPERAECLTKRVRYAPREKEVRATWAAMLQRCLNPANPNYRNYGGRGITVSEDWKDLSKFLSDMGIPEKGMQLERKDNNLGYSKENCKWASASEQSRNRRSNVVLTYKEKTQTMIEWCEELNLDYNSVQLRVQRGWNTARALGTRTVRPYAK
jgi:hypothetical protein